MRKEYLWHLVGRAKDVAQYPTTYRTAIKTYLVQNVSSTNVEKLCRKLLVEKAMFFFVELPCHRRHVGQFSNSVLFHQSIYMTLYQYLLVL